MKEKRKNIDKDELKAISLNAAEEGKAKYEAKLQKYTDKIRVKIMQGKFKTEDNGMLFIKMLGELDYQFKKDVQENLLQDFSEVEDEYCFFGTYWKIKP